uniref:SWIM-type domain-containing protein n=1 Tax=Nicotiana tabacum TaxID=4097 RepID=A0A1S4D3B3_TOBAC|nr:PREDICTED: uncharacterized protein LOC107825424 [Nicotiana tabacum]
MDFREGLRPFIGLDGTFLKRKVKGQLLLVVALDANDQAYPIAWATSSYEEDFKDQLKSIGELSKEVVELLLKYPPQACCRAYFDTLCKNQKVENNFTESVNAWLVEATQKPIIKMLEEIRIKLMNQLREREEVMRSWENDFSPHSLKLYNEYLKIANTSCYVDNNGDNKSEIREGTNKHTVNMVVKKCTCRGWDLTGISCPHAIKSLQYKKLELVNEINWWYNKEAYLLTYKYKLQSVRGEKFWKVDPSQAMEPPELVKMARPKIKRTRQKDEAIKRQGECANSRKWRVMTCTNYGEANHNARGCEKLSMAKGARKNARHLVDEDDSVGQQSEEEIHLTAPQSSQAS